jgi:hypothetical protein
VKNMHGPFGIVIHFKRPAIISEQDVEKFTGEAHSAFKTLPGFRSVVYFNINEEEYTAAVSFYTEKAASNALEPIRNRLLPMIPAAIVSRTEVVPGEFVDEFIAKGGNVQRNL